MSGQRAMPKAPSRSSLLGVVAVLFLGIGSTTASAGVPIRENYAGREILVHVPLGPPPAGSRPLVIVLHGGLGNAERIAMRQSESGLNMDAAADRDGFVVAYLDGTPVTRNMGARMLGWNAGGGCCGQSFENNIDDVTYIRGAVDHLAREYGVDRDRIFGMGHSNGAMMTQRLFCETNLYAAAVAISGPLNVETSSCPAARGRRILAIHGADDQNVPVVGGRGTKGLSRVAYASEDRSRRIFMSSGADYTLQVVPGADHMLDHIEAVIEKTEGVTIAEKAARFFGIRKDTP